MSERTKRKLNTQKVKELIRLQGRTRSWVAEKCGITAGYLAQILCGDRSPSRRVLILMAEALDVTEEDLGLVGAKKRAS